MNRAKNGKDKLEDKGERERKGKNTEGGRGKQMISKKMGR